MNKSDKILMIILALIFFLFIVNHSLIRMHTGAILKDQKNLQEHLEWHVTRIERDISKITGVTDNE